MTTPQNFANHTRRHPPFHFFVVPVLVINFIVAIVQCVRAPGLGTGWWIVVSAAFVVLMFVARINALKVQDRIIRLEERLRYQQLVTPALVQRMSQLSSAQICALRFAGDDELEELVTQTLAGRFAKPKEIKRAVRNWRGDTFRV